MLGQAGHRRIDARRVGQSLGVETVLAVKRRRFDGHGRIAPRRGLGRKLVRDGKLTNVRWGRTLAVHPDAPKAMRARLSRAFEERYGRPLAVTDVRETAVANAAGVESVFEEVPCRS